MAPREPSEPDEPHDLRISQPAGAFAAALLSGHEVAAEITIREAMDAEVITAEIDEV